jgi:hypothetical protein
MKEYNGGGAQILCWTIRFLTPVQSRMSSSFQPSFSPTPIPTEQPTVNPTVSPTYQPTAVSYECIL